MTCPFKVVNCVNHDTWKEEYGDTYGGLCIMHVWDFCTDPIAPENFKTIRIAPRNSGMTDGGILVGGKQS